jgi:polyhydroxyalkanoate synthesis regulator phasin
MPERLDLRDWRQFLDAGMQFTAMTRAEARRRAEELVREGQLAQERAQAFVDDLVRSSRQRADELLDVVRKEIQRQVEALGIATKDDLGRLEARVEKAEKAAKTRKVGAAKAAGGPKKTTAKAAKKAPVKAKAGARKSSS